MSHVVKDWGQYKTVHGCRVTAHELYRQWEIRHQWGGWQGHYSRGGLELETSTFYGPQEVKTAVDVFWKGVREKFGIKENE